jgi:hypothetical protein
MVDTAGGDVVPAPSVDLTTLLHTLDGLVELDHGFGRFLSQITPLGKDHAIAESEGIRIMTMKWRQGIDRSRDDHGGSRRRHHPETGW